MFPGSTYLRIILEVDSLPPPRVLAISLVSQVLFLNLLSLLSDLTMGFL